VEVRGREREKQEIVRWGVGGRKIREGGVRKRVERGWLIGFCERGMDESVKIRHEPSHALYSRDEL